jgi:hypothetical protein
VAAHIAALDGLLRDTLAVDDFLDFESLKEAAPRPQFTPGALAIAEHRRILLTSGRLHPAARRCLCPAPSSGTWHGSRQDASSTMPPFRAISGGKPNG